ncbi:hypothetical protein JSQ81_07215 [Sporosarcina sp. Marseille-Q4063]|uniref:hypothetical protein n=1 Tax=Sporosarcina sp. Marseille-Q4063 TaxID=2810514 RepID=UPI001BB016B3|nr:hypothetical protein [Sporosarcina sp. Marseille-Q4063]QUW23316.1 hypothetical protein JSQ81_07215 [Sporosarcina sp. Marseille-Q4063]
MKKSLSSHTTKEDTYMSDRKSTTSTPRWVKVSGIVVIILVLLVIAIMIISGGEHGPGRHLPSSNSVEQGVEQPWS